MGPRAYHVAVRVETRSGGETSGEMIEVVRVETRSGGETSGEMIEVVRVETRSGGETSGLGPRVRDEHRKWYRPPDARAAGRRSLPSCAEPAGCRHAASAREPPPPVRPALGRAAAGLRERPQGDGRTAARQADR